MNLYGIKRKVRYLQIRLRDLVSSANPNPIIIVGNQKSGTTAIAALAAMASEKKVTLDFFFRIPYAERAILEGHSSFSDFVEKHSSFFTSDIIKEPGMTFQLKEVLKQFPKAKVVFILREPVSNVRSILNRLEIGGDTVALSIVQKQFLNLKLPEWHDVMDGNLFQHSDPNPIVSLMKRAILSHEICRDMGESAIVVRYEDFLADKKKCIYDLCERLGLEVKVDIGPHVDRQFQPKGKSRKRFDEFFGEENYHRICSIMEKNRELLVSNGYEF